MKRNTLIPLRHDESVPASLRQELRGEIEGPNAIHVDVDAGLDRLRRAIASGDRPRELNEVGERQQAKVSNRKALGWKLLGGGVVSAIVVAFAMSHRAPLQATGDGATAMGSSVAAADSVFVAPMPAQETSIATEGEPRNTASSTAPIRPPNRQATSAAPKQDGLLPARSSTLSAEIANLAEIRASADKPLRVLSLADEGDRRFAAGALAEEREAAAIAALARLGRQTEAARRAERFVQRHPSSPLADDVRRRGKL